MGQILASFPAHWRRIPPAAGRVSFPIPYHEEELRPHSIKRVAEVRKRFVVITAEVLFGAIPASLVPLPVLLGFLPGMLAAVVTDDRGTFFSRLVIFWEFRAVLLIGLLGSLGAVGLWLCIFQGALGIRLRREVRVFRALCLLMMMLISLLGTVLVVSDEAISMKELNTWFGIVFFVGPLVVSSRRLALEVYGFLGKSA